ncbi:MAG: cysteine--tRNA ligase [Burkholderiales bacterium]|nr:cysteine--tRNA ligase [Burkholderiales bacterium]
MSALRIYNTLSRTKEPFVPRTPGKAGLYVCGPTVYDYFHIGNARTFTVFDMVVRWLRANGFEVTYVRNITDIDDKIMDRARERGEPIEAFTERFVEAFRTDTARLSLLPPDIEPRATRYVQPMLDMIGALEKKGHAYRGANGDVFYAVRSFSEYGKLSRRNLDDLRAGERVAVDAAKRDPLDFVLWKAAKPGEPRWASMFGDGRPGWHIECSAMSCRELGFPIDIHGGGWDLQFPHHENEIAQSEGATGTRFVNFWMHAAFLNIDHEKMSKSLGNFFTARDVLDKLDRVQGGEQMRFFLLRGHYRSEVNYSWDTLEDAGNTLRGFYTALREVAPDKAPVDWSDSYASRFRDAMNDDFDTPIAFAVLHEMRGEVNRTHSHALAGQLKALGATLGLLQSDPATFLQGVGAGLDVEALVAERIEARKARDFKRADEIRRQLEDAGIVLEDKPGGTTEWRRK